MCKWLSEKINLRPSLRSYYLILTVFTRTRIDFPEVWIMEKKNKPAGCVFVDLVTSAQAKLAIQKWRKEEPKIRNCKVSIMLATDPWKAPNAPRKIVSASARTKKKIAHPSVVATVVKKSQPIGKRTRSYYAELRKGLQDEQSSKRQKLAAEAVMDTTGLGEN
jgi:hypothetical protein